MRSQGGGGPEAHAVYASVFAHLMMLPSAISNIIKDVTYALNVSLTQTRGNEWQCPLCCEGYDMFCQNICFFVTKIQKETSSLLCPLNISLSTPGVRHSNIICDSCKKHGIMGMRWKCKVCFDYDLCTQCYMNNKHDLSHAFERYETAHSQP